MSTRIAAALAAALWLGLVGCGPDEGTGRGVVQELHEGRRVTIEHGEIPGMMKAMTMTFEVADPALLEGIEPGDRVDFAVVYRDGTYTVTSLEER